jgi:hypothetical protein
MLMLRDVRAVGMAALRLPPTLWRRGCGTTARLDDPRYGPANVLIPDRGHLTICRDARLIRSLVPELIRTETLAAPAVPADAGRELVAA